MRHFLFTAGCAALVLWALVELTSAPSCEVAVAAEASRVDPARVASLRLLDASGAPFAFGDAAGRWLVAIAWDRRCGGLDEIATLPARLSVGCDAAVVAVNGRDEQAIAIRAGEALWPDAALRPRLLVDPPGRTGEALAALGLQTAPAVLVVRPDGTVARLFRGFSSRRGDLDELLALLPPRSGRAPPH